MSYHYKIIAFDLDDTLVDTSKFLVPSAVQKSLKVMIDRGLPCSLEEAESLASQIPKVEGHYKLFYKVAHQFVGKVTATELADRAYQVFHAPDIPKDFHTFAGVPELLQRLAANYHLYLVTQGNPEFQKKKIRALDLEKYFKKIYYVDVFKKQIKKDSFRDILQNESISARYLLSVGNRLNQEIRMAKELGSTTCFVRHGEHAEEKPVGPEEIPDFQVTLVTEIEEICRL